MIYSDTFASEFYRLIQDIEGENNIAQVVTTSSVSRTQFLTRCGVVGALLDIRIPSTIVVEVKARGNERVNSLEATNVDKHRRQRGADHAIVVAPRFAPKFIDNAETTDLTTFAVDDLVELLDRRDRYVVPPEETLALLTRSGTFRDDRLDLLDESIRDRVDAGETLLTIIRALERADGAVETAEDVRWIVVGMEGSDDVPSVKEVWSVL